MFIIFYLFISLQNSFSTVSKTASFFPGPFVRNETNFIGKRHPENICHT